MRIISYLFLGAAIISAACATVTRFKSENVTIRVENGYYKATIYYKYNDSIAGKSYLRYDYTVPTTMTEVIAYSEGTRSKVCDTTCEVGFYPYGAPALFQQDGDIATGEEDGDCYEYTPAVNYAITSIWYKKDKTLCKATLADGKTLIFENAIDTTFTDDTVFNLEGKQCPAPICKRVMDLVFVIDNSGSVSSSDWEKAKSFIVDVTNSFDIGTDATMIGVIAYGKAARSIIGLNGNKDSIITAVNGAKYVGGTTCTGCGMDLAMKFFNSTSDARNSLNPEKMMIVVTDGENNELDNYDYCRKYKSECTKRGSKCTRYECKGRSHKANGPVCLKYNTTSTCLKKVCGNCTVRGQCIKYDTSTCVKKSTTKCLKYSTTYCNGNPSSYCCRRYSDGTLSNTGWCGKCECTDYRCDEYACEEYKCLAYDCNDCVTYSEECLIYKEECLQYQEVTVCDDPEECVEYECTNAKLTCAEWDLGANSLLAGAVSRTRTEWCLMPASKRLPIVIAIGVSGANKYELMGIASTLEGKQLIYTVNDYSALKTIINDLVDETCTKQTTSLDECVDGCNGFCGCNQKCYCPTCDESHGSCYTIGCRTDGTTSTGCTVTHNTCPNTNKCIKKTPNNNTEGCCETKSVDCVKSASKCKIYGCNPETGCTEKDVVCVPSSPCFVSTCDPAIGCVETSACDTSDKCKNMSCSVVNGEKKCEYKDKCISIDLCQLPVCDADTGACSLEPVNCTPKNSCFKSTCHEGNCIEDLNVTKMIECSSMAGDSCVEGYCNESTGVCDTKKIENIEDCENCGLNKTLDCTGRTDECYAYRCEAGEEDGSEYPTKCVVSKNLCKSDDPCVTKTCVAGKCVIGTPCSTPSTTCESNKCVLDLSKSQGYDCKYSTTVDEDDACWTYKCDNATGTPVRETKCPVSKCGVFKSCTIVEGKADCVYTPTHNCTSNKCVEASCNEETGKCDYVDLSVDCKGDDPCMIYMCNNESGCYSEPVVCDDDDPCTDDACVPLNATDSSYTSEDVMKGYVCVYTPKCPKRSFCEVSYCNSEGKCTYSDYACDGPNETGPIDSCHTLQCSDITNSCESVILPSAFLDVCGSCVKEYGKDPTLNETSAATLCIAGMKMPDFAAAIGGAAVAGIVIAAIIVAAILGVSSALGTKELIKRAKKNADVGTNSNPLYEGNDNEASNPAFTGEN